MITKDFIFPETKKSITRQQSKIMATASYFPEHILTNQDIIDINNLKVTDTVIRKTQGIEKRRVAGKGLADSDLLVKAAQICLKKAKIKPDQLSKILVTKFLGDRMLPMTASLVQRKLNCTSAMHAVDIEGGINAFLHAFDLAVRYISTSGNPNQYILILSGGLHHLPVSKTDPRLAFLFGDGATAILMTTASESHILASYLYSNPVYYKEAGTPLLRMDKEFSNQLYEAGQFENLFNWYRMTNWKDNIDFYLQAAKVTRDRLLQESKISMNEIDLVLVTENNKKIRDLTLEALDVPIDKSLSIIRDHGNLMSAMLPALIDKAFKEGQIKKGKKIMLISHGEGASGGGIIYQV